MQFGWRKLSILQWHSVYGALLFVRKAWALKPNGGPGRNAGKSQFREQGQLLVAQGLGWSPVQVFACSEGGDRGTEVGDARAESRQSWGQQERVPSWAQQGVQRRCKGRGAQGWSLSLPEEDRRAREQEAFAKGGSTCHLKGICANQF